MKAIIIGGGVIGNSIAWQLASERAGVVLFERGRFGKEASWAAAGLIAPQAEAEGPGPFLDYCLHARAAFEAIAGRLQRESGVDPEYDPVGAIYIALDADDREELERRAAWQRAAGLEVEELNAAQIRALAPVVSEAACYGLNFRKDRRVENRKLAQAYARAAQRAGADIIEGVQAEEIFRGVGGHPAVRLHDGSVHESDAVVVAAGAWASQIRGLEADGVPMRPVRGQIVCFEAPPGALEPSLLSLNAYLVPRRDGRLIAGSTRENAGYNKTVTLDGMEKIVRGVRALAPVLATASFREAWAGLRPATPDLLPVLGPSPSMAGVFHAGGHYRSGILLSALTGEVVASLVLGHKSPVDIGAFSPARFSRSGASK